MARRQHDRASISRLNGMTAGHYLRREPGMDVPFRYDGPRRYRLRTCVDDLQRLHAVEGRQTAPIWITVLNSHFASVGSSGVPLQ